MRAAVLIESLERFPRVLATATSDVSSSDARWKPPDGAWSILEVACHLADEEVQDFRLRLKITLEDPKADWPPIAPSQWAVERQYNEQDLKTTVERFVGERQKSIVWLKSLKNPDWSTMHTRPKFGSMRAGDLLASWAAHDALHLRQIAKRMHQLAQFHGGEFKTGYAGEWTT